VHTNKDEQCMYGVRQQEKGKEKRDSASGRSLGIWLRFLGWWMMGFRGRNFRNRPSWTLLGLLFAGVRPQTQRPSHPHIPPVGLVARASQQRNCTPPSIVNQTTPDRTKQISIPASTRVIGPGTPGALLPDKDKSWLLDYNRPGSCLPVCPE
jgi:hypothetical protein